MKGILADINIHGHLEILLQVWLSEEWREIWESLNLLVWTFTDLGLDPRTPDSVLWHECQKHQIVFLTANRNDDGPDSLEATIRAHNSESCLPVFTLSDPQRLQAEKKYAGKVAIKLLQYFLEIDTVRGTGRMFVP